MSLSRASSAAQIDRRTVANKKSGISNDRGADRNISRQLLRSGNDYFSQNSSHSTASSTRAHSTAHNYSSNRSQIAKPEQKTNMSSFKTTEKTSNNIIQSVVHQHHQNIQSNLQKSWKQPPFQKQPQPYSQPKPVFSQQLSYQQLSQTQKQQDPYEDQIIQKSTCCFSPKCSAIKPTQKKEFKPLNFDHITFRQSQEECICEGNLLLKQSFQSSSPSHKQFNNSKDTLQQHLQSSQQSIQQSETSTSMPIPIINSACSSPTNASLNYYSTKNQHKKPSPGSSPSNSTSGRSPMILGVSSRQSSNDSKQTAMTYNHPVIQSQQQSSMKNNTFTANASIPGTTMIGQYSLTPSNSATSRILEIKASQQSYEQPKTLNKKPPSSLASVHQQFTLQYLQQLKQATNHIQYQHQSASPFNKCTSNELSSKELAGSQQHCFPVSSVLKEQASPRVFPNNNNTTNNKTNSVNPSPRNTSVLVSSLNLNQSSQFPIAEPNKNVQKINSAFFKEQDEILHNEVVAASKDVANKLKQDIQPITTCQQGNQNLYVKFTNKYDACNHFYTSHNNSNQDSYRKVLESNEGHRMLHINDSNHERNNDLKSIIKFQNSQTNQSPSSPSSPLFRCNYQNSQLSLFEQQSSNNCSSGQLAQKANISSEKQKYSFKTRQQQSLESKPIRENRYIEKSTPRKGIATITSAVTTTATNMTHSIPQGQQSQQEQQSPTFFPCIPPSLNGEQSFSLSNHNHQQQLQLSNKNNIKNCIISQDIQDTPKTEEDAISSLLFVQKEFKSGNRIGDSPQCFGDEKLGKNCSESGTRTHSTTVTTARSPKSCNSNSSHNNNNNTSASIHSQFIGSFQNDAKIKQENFSAADSAAKSSNESILSTNRQLIQQPQDQLLLTIQLRINRALSSHLEKEEILKKENDSLKTQLALLSSTVATQAAQIAMQQAQITQITQTQSIQQQQQEHSSEDITKFNSSPKNQFKDYFQQTLNPHPPAAHSFQTLYSLQQQNSLKPASSHNTNDHIDPLQMTFNPSPFEISFQQAKLNENNSNN